MDLQTHDGHGAAPMGHTYTPEASAPVNHQLPEHGSPDPHPLSSGMSAASNFDVATPSYKADPPTSATPFTGGSFEPEPPASVPPVAAASPLIPSSSGDDSPVPVVKVLSVRGVEYAFMTFTLWFGAASLIWLLVALVTGQASFQLLAFPLSTLLISLPIFTFLFIKLRKEELADSSLRLEPSKRRFSQITQILAFLVCFFNLIDVVYTIISKMGGGNGSIGKTLAGAAVTLVIAGGILVYYWFDEHRLVRK